MSFCQVSIADELTKSDVLSFFRSSKGRVNEILSIGIQLICFHTAIGKNLKMSATVE